MTTILAIQGDDYALICSDSRISTMDSGGFASQITTLGSGSAKVAENGKYLLGAAGDMRAINIIHHHRCRMGREAARETGGNERI